MFVGVYHHAAPADSPFVSKEIRNDNFNEAAAFVSAYVAKSLVFLRKLPVLP